MQRRKRAMQKASPAALEMVVQGFEAAGLQALHHGLQIGGIPQLDIYNHGALLGQTSAPNFWNRVLE
jgi:hypothetical protein